MSQKPKKLPKKGKDEDEQKLKSKLKQNKKEILRLNRKIRELENKIEELLNGKDPKPKKQKKVKTDILNEAEKKEQAKRVTIEKFKKEFSGGKEENNISP